VSGTGTVASGVVWPDGHVALRWMADHGEAVSSTSIWSSVADMVKVHGHGGASEVIYLDAEAATDDVAILDAAFDRGCRRSG
jgi:hypothetical protein